MDEELRIAGYCRISVDEELDKDNTSIENQKAIISDYVNRLFPDAELDFYEDRDRSGYTFEQRENYQVLRKKMFRGDYDILIVKDFSRFSRRTSRGLVELEDLRDAHMRIISIGDGIDFPTSDDWTAIQFRFLINEMPVTDTSKKVKAVIRHRQEEGKWICAVPYGYIMTNSKMMKFTVDESAAEIVRKVFQLYADGWGYKKIANYLTDNHIPTPRKAEEMRKDAEGEEHAVRSKTDWSIVTISGILTNDFYIGTLRQRKYRRKKINGGDEKLQESENIVIENNHEPIVDFKLFSAVQEQMKQRSNSNYRGVKKYDNIYTGRIFCGDCGSPMFSMSRSDLQPAYRCGTYHRRGIKGCTSHHTRVDMLDGLLREFIQKVKDNSQMMLEQLQASIDKEQKQTSSSKTLVETLTERMEDAKTEIKMLNHQRIADKKKRPEKADMIDELYEDQINELMYQIEGYKNQIRLALDKHNAIVNVNRTAKTVMEIFDAILSKKSLTKVDVDFIIDRIDVYIDHIDIRLKSDIDALLKTGVPEELMVQQEEAAVNFNEGTKKTENLTPFAKITTSKGEILSVNIISEGDPLEIFTDSGGEVVFKKYSPMGEMASFAEQYAEVLSRVTKSTILITDRDHVVSVSGTGKREFIDRRITPELEDLMERRKSYIADRNTRFLKPIEGSDRAAAITIPVISSGDITGCIIMMIPDTGKLPDISDTKVLQTAADFLGRRNED